MRVLHCGEPSLHEIKPLNRKPLNFLVLAYADVADKTLACPVFNHGTGAVAIWVVITQEHGLAEGKLLLKLVLVAVIATLGTTD